MNPSFKIILVFIEKGIGVIAFFLGFMSLAFSDSPQVLYVAKMYHIPSLFFLTILFVALANASFYFKAVFNYNGYFSSIAFFVFSFLSLLSFGIGLYRLTHVEVYKTEILALRTSEVATLLAHLSQNKTIPSIEEMGFLLTNRDLIDDRNIHAFENILISNADFVFSDPYIGREVFNQDKKVLINKGMHLVEVLLIKKDYSTLKKIAPFIKNPNYRDPEHIGSLTFDKSLFQKIFEEFVKHNDADVGEVIATLIAQGADLFFVDISGANIHDRLLKQRDMFMLYLADPKLTQSDTNLYNQKILEINTILSLVSDVVPVEVTQ